MRARFLTALSLIPLAAVLVHAESNAGAGASYEAGGNPISAVIPQVFIQKIYRSGPWDTFGLELSVAVSPVQNSSFANGLAAGPEVFLGTNASYFFPKAGPVEFAALLGACGCQDYHKLAEGVAAQAGLEASVHFGSFFIAGRGLYRFFSSTGTSGVPVPVGTYGLVLLGGYTLP